MYKRQVKSLSDIEQIVIKNVGGIPVLVRDVAGVDFGHANRFGALVRNGEGEAVGGIVLMLKGANSANTVNAVKERIARIQKSLPEGIEIVPFIERTKLINKTITTVSENLLLGGLIAVSYTHLDVYKSQPIMFSKQAIHTSRYTTVYQHITTNNIYTNSKF